MSSSIMSNTVTRNIRVTAVAQYMPEYSDPTRGRFIFVYRITITNEGRRMVKLISRHWVIINSDGKKEEVQGFGVVGKQPELEPGRVYEYNSFCPLDTDFGTMEGTYQMLDDTGDLFEINIGRFYLAINAPQVAIT